MVRNSLQKAVLVDFLLAWNQFRTNNNAVFFGTAVDPSINWTGWKATIVQKTEFQNQFFKKWMTDYWDEAKTPLNKENSTIGDLNLNSRAKSSSGSRSTNDSWSKRCNNYIHSKDNRTSDEKKKISHQKHHQRQIIAVQRVNVLEQYILSHPELLNK